MATQCEDPSPHRLALGSWLRAGGRRRACSWPRLRPILPPLLLRTLLCPHVLFLRVSAVIGSSRNLLILPILLILLILFILLILLFSKQSIN